MRMLAIDLKGRLALVTGASGNLGSCIAETLAKCGADVVVHYHKNAIKAAEVVEHIKAQGVRGMAIQADITQKESIASMKQEIEKVMGHPDIIVNNSVVQYLWTSLLEQPLEDYESQFQSCVMQNVLMAKAFVPAMIEKGYGRIIAINTECTMQAFETQSAYVAGKKGMDGLLRVLAKEIGPYGITVNQVAPGWTIGEKDRGKKAEDEAYVKGIPLRRRPEDQDIAQAVAFLASDLAGMITGIYLPVCGGNVMPGL